MSRRHISLILCSQVTLLSVLALGGCSLSSVELPTLEKPSVQQAQSASQAKLTPKVTDDNLVTPQTLTVGIKMSSNIAPFVMQTDYSGLCGLDVDLAYALGDALGLKVSFVEISDVGRSLGKTCDIVLNAKQDETTVAKIVGGYAESAAALFGKSTGEPLKASNLSGKRVALQKGSISELAYKRSGLTMKPVECSNLNEAFDAVQSGKADYVLCEAYAGAYMAKPLTNITCVGTLDKPVQAGIAVASKNETLQHALEQVSSTIQENGILQLIRSRWVGSRIVFSADTQIKGMPAPQTKNSESSESKDKDASNTSSAGSNAVNI
ncbi:ABC transporter substrate-binding protein [Fannyhessea vaginae]|uniref:substrate-binding periplasmic protein n=1 Tax=Fannyhessea vaginae TaxID=82135 RepID=UPI00065E6D35|nr:transporter substrate-binding domain-containing protein [Fannyhessea vaginae]KMT48195.1 ABC transporter substrate-binding protein [Fannyhessea vaginae]